MRRYINLNNNWDFIKEGKALSENNLIGHFAERSYTQAFQQNKSGSYFRTEPKSSKVNLPHTWNALDGQDGGDDYYRGKCIYRKEIDMPELETEGEAYLEFRGANSSAEVKVNGVMLGTHDGGYSTFRVKVTEELKEKNVIEVVVDNMPNDRVYPQKADFTFYGGIYRDVFLILVPRSHFNLDYYGAPGIKVTPKIEGENAIVSIETFITGLYDKVKVEIEGIGFAETTLQDKKIDVKITIPKVHYWNGKEDPFLYKANAMLYLNDEIIDEISTDFGCRTYHFDPQQGFFLNGKSHPLHGVSRHQDFKGLGNAVTKEIHENDIKMILEMGANSIRLAHYQHDQYVYDLCDRYGLIVWAEIPYITKHIPEGRENTISQMKELIAQNYNHPSIICWALSNEISVAGVTDDLLENHRILNDLVHNMDSTRITVMADAFMLETDSSLNDIPDIFSYNLYYGWYMGELEDNDRFFDDFHHQYPDRCIGLSEYGADAFYKLQSPKPEKGDYSEQYQCIYHEHMLEMFDKRPYLWGTYVWNMFDFGADGREEAGDNGVNHKGLVSFDRCVKKDAFYIYKAWWSETPFVHLCSKRYVDRIEETTIIKVYSNQKKLALYQDGKLLEEKEGHHVFLFQADIFGEHEFEVKSGNCKDSMRVRKVEKANPEYYLETSSIKNWFDEPGMEVVPGFYSIQDTLEEIKKTPDGKILMDEMVTIARAARGEVTKNVNRTPEMERMLNSTTVAGFIKISGGAITFEMAVELNQKLNKIKKSF